LLARLGVRAVAFRPPFGDWSAQAQAVVARRLPVVEWDVVSGDPDARLSARAIVDNVVPKVRPGSIVIFHINGREQRTAEALPVVLATLRARGYRFVHLSELLALDARHPVAPRPPGALVADTAR